MTKKFYLNKVHTQAFNAAQGCSRGAQGPADQGWHREMHAQGFPRGELGCLRISPSCARVCARVGATVAQG